MLRFESHKELELTDGVPEYPAIVGPVLLGNPAGRLRLNCAPQAVDCPLSPLRRLTAQLNGCFSGPNLIHTHRCNETSCRFVSTWYPSNQLPTDRFHCKLISKAVRGPASEIHSQCRTRDSAWEAASLRKRFSLFRSRRWLCHY